MKTKQNKKEKETDDLSVRKKKNSWRPRLFGPETRLFRFRNRLCLFYIFLAKIRQYHLRAPPKKKDSGRRKRK